MPYLALCASGLSAGWRGLCTPVVGRASLQLELLLPAGLLLSTLAVSLSLLPSLLASSPNELQELAVMDDKPRHPSLG